MFYWGLENQRPSGLVSQGERDLGELLRQEFPVPTIKPQHSIKVGRTTLYLDYYIPAMNLAFEYDGQQHFEYNRFHHGSRQGFENSKGRDRMKSDWCKDNNIVLVRLDYRNPVTLQLLRKSIIETINATQEKG